MVAACVLQRLTTVLLVTVAALGLAGCPMPPTMQQCAQKEDADERDRCTESRTQADVAIGGSVGAVGGAAAGAATGAAIGGAHGAIIGAIVGAAAGGTTGALITYYVDKRESDALADAEAYKRRSDEAVNYYRDKLAEADDRIESLGNDLNAAKAELQRLSDLYNRLSNTINIMANNSIPQYTQAVQYRFGSVPIKVSYEVSDLQNRVSQLESERQRLIRIIQKLNAVINSRAPSS